MAYITDDAIPGDGKLHEVTHNGKAVSYTSAPGNTMHYACPVRLDKVTNWCSGKRSQEALSALKEAGWVYELIPAAFPTEKGAGDPKGYGLVVWPKSLTDKTQQAMRRVTRAALLGQSRTAY